MDFDQAEALQALEYGHLHSFSDWPNDAVPRVAAGAYTIWEEDRLVYAGMAGRSLTAEAILQHRDDPTRITGLNSRLSSHASGRRSGDQFCVYVADFLVLPQINAESISGIGDRSLRFDDLIRSYIHDNLAYRFVEVPDGAVARALEADVRKGALKAGKPQLNPI